MIIKLYNFKCYKGHHSFEFPNNGVVLLAGESGMGKSTILKALEFALYGVGKNIFTHNTSKCSVELTFNQPEKGIHFKIFRQRGPGLLKYTDVKNNGIIYQDDVAQNIIDDYFGNETIYGYTNICHQDVICPFLLGNNSDKIKLLEHVAFKSQNFVYKKKLQEKISECEGERKNFSTRVEMSKNNCMELESKLQSKNIKLDQEIKSAEMLQQNSVNLQNEMTRYEIEIKNITLANHVFQKNKSSFENYKKEYDSQISCFKNLNLVYHNSILDGTNTALIDEYLEMINNELFDISNKMNELNNYKENLAANNATRREIEKIETKIATVKSSCNLSDVNDVNDFILKKNELLSKNSIYQLDALKLFETFTNKCLQYIFKPEIFIPSVNSNLMLNLIIEYNITKNFSYNDYMNLYSEFKKMHDKGGAIFGNCPNCDLSLVVVNNEILDSSLVKMDLTPDQNLIIHKLCQYIEGFNENSYKETCKDEKIDLKDCNISQLQEMINTFNENTTSIGLLQNLVDLYNQLNIYKNKPIYNYGINQNGNGNENENGNVNVIINPEEEIKKLKTRRDEIQRSSNTIKTIANKINNLGLELNSTSVLISGKEIVDISHLEKKYKETKEQYNKCMTDINDCEWLIMYNKKVDEKNELATKLNQVQENYTNLCFFRNLILECESELFESTLTSLSCSVNNELEYLFTSNINVTLKTEVKANVRTGIDLNIIFKGAQYKSHSELSGGESKRLGVAFLLAFNKYVNGKFLILDETLSCVGTQLRLDTIELLKNLAQDKLIIIINHDIVEGQFDTVVQAGFKE